MKPYYQNDGFTLYHGDSLEVLKLLEPKSINCCVTSPPYFGLRDYAVNPVEWPEIIFSPMAGLPNIIIEPETCCFGLEKTPISYIGHCVHIFREVSKVLKNDGTLWLNLGDSYAGSGKGRNSDGSHQEGGKQGTSRGTIEGKLNKTLTPGLKPKDMIGIPWRVALALQADDWYLRQDIIWSKPNPMPESVKDRCTKAHEYIFLLSKSDKYYFDHEAIKEPAIGGQSDSSASFKRSNSKRGIPIIGQAKGTHRPDREGTKYNGETRNKRSVWTVSTKPYKEAHFATFPSGIPEICIKAGCPKGGIVLDLFNGAGTTGMVAHELGMQYIGIDIKKEYLDMTIKRVESNLNQTRF